MVIVNSHDSNHDGITTVHDFVWTFQHFECFITN